MKKQVRSLNYNPLIFVYCSLAFEPGRPQEYDISVGSVSIRMRDGFARIDFSDILETDGHDVSHEKTGFHPNDCIRHLLNVFNGIGLKKLQFRSEAGLNMEKVKAAVDGIPLERLKIDETDRTHTRYMLKNFVPQKELWIDEYQDVYEDVLIGNLRFLMITNASRLKLQQLLMCNVRILHLQTCQMTSKNWNQFLKCWKEGSTPNLVRLYADNEEEPVLSEEAVLKGIAGRRMANGETREVASRDDRMQMPRFEPETITHGFEISRYDERKAVVQVELTYDESIIQFYVLH